jgi:hypothetical protein
MSFQTSLYNILSSDTSLNSLVNGVYFDNLPANFDLTKDWIVYNYSEAERVQTLSFNNVLTYYTVFVKVVSKDTNKLLKISDEINKYLTEYRTNNYLNIDFVSDSHQNGVVDDMDIYENSIEYRIAYIQ